MPRQQTRLCSSSVEITQTAGSLTLEPGQRVAERAVAVGLLARPGVWLNET